MYGHSLNTNQWLSVLVVFVGLSGEVVDKYNKKQTAKLKEAAAKVGR